MTFKIDKHIPGPADLFESARIGDSWHVYGKQNLGRRVVAAEKRTGRRFNHKVTADAHGERCIKIWRTA